MKTSNKLLLGTFLTVLLIFISLHIALFAKYKKGDYKVLTDDMWPMNFATYSLENVKYVSVSNMGNFRVQASDSNKLQYVPSNDESNNSISFTKKGDTLFILGENKRAGEGRWYNQTELFVKNNVPVRFTNSIIGVKETNNKESFFNWQLDNSVLAISADTPKKVFTEMTIRAANKSRIEFRNIDINRLDVSLQNSSFEEDGLKADSIYISTDANSQIQLSGTNLTKAKLQTFQ